jgi:DNA-binding transcriptional ArsR family regulator
MSANITSLLKKTEEEYEAKRAELESLYAKKRSEVLRKVTSDLAGAFATVIKVYDSIPKEERQNVLSDSLFTDALKHLGLSLKDGKGPRAQKAGAGARAKVSDEAILKFLDKERQTSEIGAEFSLSAVTVSKRLNALLGAKSVSVRKDGVKKFWKAV